MTTQLDVRIAVPIGPSSSLPTCNEIEDLINENIEKHICDKLVLDWAEDRLKSPCGRNCQVCHGYGCQVCIGRGTRW